MITEDLRELNVSEDIDPMTAFLGMNAAVTVRREVIQDRARMSDMMFSHGEEIELLQKHMDEKDREIVELRKAVETLEEHNQELNVALKSRNEEIKTLKTRIGRLENDKKELEDELRSVKV